MLYRCLALQYFFSVVSVIIYFAASVKSLTEEAIRLTHLAVLSSKTCLKSKVNSRPAQVKKRLFPTRVSSGVRWHERYDLTTLLSQTPKSAVR